MSAPSPCVGICILEDGVCIGCGRSMDEIFDAGVAAGHPDTRQEKTAEPEEES